MKITVRVVPNEKTRYFDYDLSDYDVTDEMWQKMSKEEQDQILREFVGDEFERPYWVLDTYEEKY